ncbi:MAG: T9SS type A sorting domain-containing protein [Ginsengibacter sp.]
MKQLLLFLVITFLFFISHAQVTQINANKSLHGVTQLNNTLAIFQSGIDASIWVSDGTKDGTFQISDTIKYIGGGGLLNGKYIFKGQSPNCGNELFITDGTKGGTTIVKDINPGTANSQPRVTIMGATTDYIYFAAVTPLEGCELWRTDGTKANTTLVKDIGVSTTSGIDSTHFAIGLVGNIILFTATTPTNGNELWSTDGTPGNTSLLKDIDAGIISSNASFFYPFNDKVLFSTKAADGIKSEIWRSDGTTGGTVLLKDNISPSFATSIFFHIFKNRAYFLINDNVHLGDAMYSTDGIDATVTHTNFLKVLGSSTLFGSMLLVSAINLSDKFIFQYYNIDLLSGLTIMNDLYQCDGTDEGTKVFKSFALNNNFPFIYSSLSFDIPTKTIIYPLFNGKFYFSGDDGSHGNELWMSDGTNSSMLEDMNPGLGDGIINSSFLFTSSYLFFAANDGVHGNELLKTNGTKAGTTMVKDIFPGTHNADPSLEFINNGKIFFSAKDSDPSDSSVTDLYVVDGNFSPLPVNLLNFTVTTKDADALLQWSTAQELNSRNFIIQSSDDAQHWNQIGTLAAAGNSSLQNNYSFIDAGVMNSGKNIVYYRLKETDLDGQTTNSNIIYLKIKGNSQWNVQLYSNPVHDNNVKIMLTGVQGNAGLTINDLNGRVIYKKQIQNQNGLINIAADIPSGVYILHITTVEGSKSIKFVKE